MGVARAIKNFFIDLVDILCPKICLGCGRRIQTDNEQLICSDCLTSFPKVDYYKKDENHVTDFFYSESVRIEYGCCFLQFQKGDTTQHLIHNIKYYGHPELGVKLGRIAGHQLKKYNRFTDVDFIIPVPMHPKKLKTRGFNQAERIGQGLTEILGIPIKEGILLKTVNSESQTRLNREQRAENSNKIFGYQDIDETDTSHYLIVDDVFTTGSTLLVCARKLREARPNCKISVFALGKA